MDQDRSHERISRNEGKGGIEVLKRADFAAVERCVK
jgi:hypothetical protein